MKIVKNPIFMFVLGIIFSGTVAFAVTNINASEVSYTDKNNVERTVDKALDDLYNKVDSSKVATQVATLTTQGATYTMRNDGYIVGTAWRTPDGSAAVLFLNSTQMMISDHYTNTVNNVSVYASKDTVVTTRSDGGNYNLTVYEWK